jgi:hypothetical protein
MKRRLRVKTYALISDAIDKALEAGWRRARKHNDTPSPEWIVESQHRYIMAALDEIVAWDDEEGK